MYLFLNGGSFKIPVMDAFFFFLNAGLF